MSDDKPDFEVVKIDHLTARDEAWQAVEKLMRHPNPQVGQEAARIQRYLRLIEKVSNDAFNALSRDNNYSPGRNEAWRLLGKLLQKLHSDEEPFTRKD